MRKTLFQLVIRIFFTGNQFVDVFQAMQFFFIILLDLEFFFVSVQKSQIFNKFL